MILYQTCSRDEVSELMKAPGETRSHSGIINL